jgi:hypothetical protein
MIIIHSEVRVMQKNFGAYLMVKVYGMFVILTFCFFVLLKVNGFANNQMFSKKLLFLFLHRKTLKLKHNILQLRFSPYWL